MTPYNIGIISVVLEDISAIGIVHASSMSEKHLDIYLRSGVKVVATFEATQEERMWSNGTGRGYADLCSSLFVERVESEIKEFRHRWYCAIKYADKVNTDLT